MIFFLFFGRSNAFDCSHNQSDFFMSISSLVCYGKNEYCSNDDDTIILYKYDAARFLQKNDPEGKSCKRFGWPKHI